MAEPTAHDKLVLLLAQTSLHGGLTFGQLADAILAITDAEDESTKVRRFCTRIAAITTADEQAVLEVGRLRTGIEAWLPRLDAIDPEVAEDLRSLIGVPHA